MRFFLAKNLLQFNKNNADDNRKILRQNHILMINIIGSPGCGKTSLLEHTLKKLSVKYKAAVIEGDLYTGEDALRLEPWCHRVIQINTEGGCHLEAGYIGHLISAKETSLLDVDVIFIENIGNLICPAEFDLGEDFRVSVLSVTEGNDKPRKYPLAFQGAAVTLITKTDLLPYCNFNLDLAVGDLKKINSELEVFPVSSIQDGKGLDHWFQWIESRLEATKRNACS